MDSLKKIQNLPEEQRKIILWLAVGLVGVMSFFFFIKRANRKIEDFKERNPFEEIEVPSFEPTSDMGEVKEMIGDFEEAKKVLENLEEIEEGELSPEELEEIENFEDIKEIIENGQEKQPEE